MTENTTETLKRLAPQFVVIDSLETLATPAPWVRDGFNMAALLKCVAERGSPEAKHTCGDYEKMAECEGVNWKHNALFLEAARKQTRPLLDAHAKALRELEKAREVLRFYAPNENGIWNDDDGKKAKALLKELGE